VSALGVLTSNPARFPAFPDEVIRIKSLSISRQPDFTRFLTAVRRGVPDVVPFIELGIDDSILERLLEEPLVPPGTPEDQVMEAYLRNRLRCLAALGFDHYEISCNHGLSLNFLTADDTAVYSHGSRSWRDENRGSVETWEDFERYPWPRPEAIDYSAVEIAARNLPDGMMLTGATGGGVLEYAMWIMGYTPFSYALYDAPDLVAAVFSRIGEILLAGAEAMASHDKIGAIFEGDDMGHKHGLLVSADVIRAHALPWHKKMAAAAHAHGKPYILHACGDLSEIMDDLIDDCGIDAKHSFEDVIMPVAEIKRRWGDRIAICGGVDVDKFSRWPEAELRAYVRKVLEDCAPGGGYLLGSGNSVPNYIPAENFLAMLDEGVRFSGG
jgi:uroporphyrinogen decarboxylase